MEREAKGHKGLLPLIIIAGVAVFSLLQYDFTLRENKKISRDLEMTRTNLKLSEDKGVALKKELDRELRIKEELLQQNAKVENELKLKTEELARVEISVKQLEQSIGQTQAENTSLNEKVTKLSEEKVNLEARLHSIAELKKAISELRKEAKRVRKQAQKNIIKVEKISKDIEYREGNAGYITKDGKATYSQRKVEVIPVP